jgi:hypothetical protein
MARFEELQSLWQNQAARGPSPREAAALSLAVRRYGRRYDLIYCAKALAVCCCAVFLVSQLRHRLLTLLGAALAVSGGILFLVHDWRAQRSIALLNFADPSTAFLRNAIVRLNAQRNPFRTREFYLAMGLYWVGCTLMLLTGWYKMTVAGRVAGHALVTAAPFLIYRLGGLVRRRRFDHQIVPLIERLTALLETIERDRA